MAANGLVENVNEGQTVLEEARRFINIAKLANRVTSVFVDSNEGTI